VKNKIQDAVNKNELRYVLADQSKPVTSLQLDEQEPDSEPNANYGLSLKVPFKPEFANPSSRTYKTTSDAVSKQIGNVLAKKEIPGYKDVNVESMKRNDDGNTDIDLRMNFSDGTDTASALKEKVQNTIQDAVDNNEFSLVLFNELLFFIPSIGE
jgi:hypothetical protein